MKLALCQMTVEKDKQENLKTARKMLRRAANSGAELAVLPEMFTCPYDHEYFSAFAEEEGGETLTMLSSTAKEEGIWIVGGTIPRRSAGGRVYNTCHVWNDHGEMVAVYHKVHLFDIDLGEEARFQESATLAPGNRITLFNLGGIRIGLGICYDLRFPEFTRLLSLAGADLVIFPAAFTQVTGEAHWELLLKSRAVDNQVFIAGVSRSTTPAAGYQAYGHSMVIDAWGRIEDSLGQDEGLLFVDINAEKTAEIRRNLPLLAHRRTDLYRLIGCGPWQGRGDDQDH